MTATATAPMPTRGHTSFTLAWGLLSVPVSVFTGTEATRVVRKEFTKGDPTRPVGRIAYDKTSVAPNGAIHALETDEVVRMAQATSGEWVALTDDEIADATSTIRGQGAIEAFVPVKNVGQYLTEGQAQVRPKREKGKANPAAEKAFALLLKAMKSRKVVALVKVAMRGPARYALLDSTGTLSLILTADAIREARPLESVTVSPAELAMAEMLIDAVGVSTPVLTDTNAPLVQRFVDQKATGVTPTVVEAAAPVVDVMADLAASIAAAKAARAA